MNQKSHVVCNLNCLFKNEGILKVTRSYLRSKGGIVSRKRCKMESLLLLQTISKK